MAASSDQVVNMMWEIQEMRMRLAQHELNQLYAIVGEYDPMYHTEDQQNFFMAEVGLQMKDLSNFISDIANRRDMLRGSLSQTTEHQTAQDDQCTLMSEISPEVPNVHGEQSMELELMSGIDRPQDEVLDLGKASEDNVIEEFLALLENDIPNEDHGVEEEEKNMEDENINIIEYYKVFNVVDPHLDTDDGLKGCFFHYYLTPFFDFHVDDSNETFLKYGGYLDWTLGDLDFQVIPKIVHLAYHWDSTDEALKFDEKWPPPISSFCLVSLCT